MEEQKIIEKNLEANYLETEKINNPFENNTLIWILSLCALVWTVFNFVFVNSVTGYEWIGFFIFEIVFLLTIWKGIVNKVKLDGYLIFSWIILILMSLWFGIYTNPLFAFFFFIIIFWGNSFITLYISWIWKNIWDKFPILFRSYTFYLVILGNIGKSIKLLKPTENAEKKENNTITIAISLVVLVCILAVIVPLLSNADEVFKMIIDKYVIEIFDLPKIIKNLLVIMFVWMMMWSGLILWNNHKSIENKSRNIEFPFKAIWSSIVLTWINLVYLLFIVIQIKYLFFGSHEMIVNMGFNSYAEYVHKWFAELIIIGIINFVIYVVIQSTIKNEWNYKYLKWMLWILIAMNISITISALVRIYKYVYAYWLTTQRIFVFYIIFLIFGMMIFCLYKLYNNKWNYFRYIFVLFLWSFTILGYSNIDKIIAKFNIEHNHQVNSQNSTTIDSSSTFKRSKQLDSYYIMTLSPDAIDEQIQMTKMNPKLLSRYNCKYSKILNTKVPLREYNYFKSKIKFLWKCWEVN